MAKKKPNIVMNTFVLVIITFVAITALAAVHQITAEPIAQAEVNMKAEAYKVVYPDAEEFTEIDGLDKMIEKSASLLTENGFEGCTVTDVLGVKGASGETEGYIIASSSPNGYGGEIQTAIGIKDGKLTGFTTISNNETAGLGSKCTEPDFTEQFKDKAASVLSYTKSGASSDTEIDAISGATITTNAVTESVNAAILFFQENFGGGVQEIAKPDLTEFYKQAYPDAKEFGDIENADAMLADSAKLLTEYNLKDCTIEEVKSVNNGEGYVVSATAIGFAKTSPLQIAIGIKEDKITGFAVVNQMETPGYGAKCTESDYTKQFTGKKLDILTSVKDGAKKDNEVDAISGATITSNAVTNAVNAAILFYQTNFGDGSVVIDKEAIADTNNVDATAGATAA